jgi:hypothetical protein
MTDNNLQPTVLVKKADGTFTRMTLDEIKKMKENKAPILNKPAEAKAQVPNISNTQQIVAPAKIIQKEKPPALKIAVAKEEFRSLLEEKLPNENDDRPKISSSRTNQVEEVIKKLNFKVAPENNNRLRSIIQLRLKEIRDAEETKETVMRRAIDGGLGLVESQANELERECERQILPEVFQEPLAPANETPFNSFVHNAEALKHESMKALKQEGIETQKNNDISKPVVLEEKSVALKLNTQPQTRQTMQDITPPSYSEVGPVRELAMITLVDFRRLAGQPAEAASRLKQKFINLRDESFLLFIDGLSAWYISPLYLDYTRALAESLEKRQTLVSLLTDKKRIQVAEIQAIAEMEREL